MNFLHYEFDLQQDDVVEVTLDHQANVRLLDDANYAIYESGGQHRYYGGVAKSSPVNVAAPTLVTGTSSLIWGAIPAP